MLRKNAAEIEKERARKFAVLDARLRNWGLSVRGGYPGGSLQRGDDERPTPNELDAEIIEWAMLRVRQRRPKLFRLARFIYIGDKPMMILTQAFRCSERKIHELHGKLLSVVGNLLENHDI